MSGKELRSYRLSSAAEPSDEMLDAIMSGVAETARKTSIQAQIELDRQFANLQKAIVAYRKTEKQNARN